MNKSTHPITMLAERYPQLKLPISDLTRLTEEYKNVVLSGENCEREPQFSYSEFDFFEKVSTPAGMVDVLYLFEREDFEHAIRALAYRCENRPIEKSMGASTIFKIPNWVKIKDHMAKYDGLDSDAEFAKFTSDKSNYTDTIIILSSGSYSNVNGSLFKIEDKEWLEISKTIRKYHELSHFISSNNYPDNKEPIRDEVVADMIGIVAALKNYDTNMAKTFLGIEGKEYRQGGRLQNYSNDLDKDIIRCDRIIDSLYREYNRQKISNPFELLKIVESNKIGIF